MNSAKTKITFALLSSPPLFFPPKLFVRQTGPQPSWLWRRSRLKFFRSQHHFQRRLQLPGNRRPFFFTLARWSQQFEMMRSCGSGAIWTWNEPWSVSALFWWKAFYGSAWTRCVHRKEDDLDALQTDNSGGALIWLLLWQPRSVYLMAEINSIDISLKCC